MAENKASIALSTAGISLQYAVESVSGTRPTGGYTTIPEVKSMGELNVAPASIDVTTLAERVYKRYIPGLKDLGGSREFTANLTNTLIDAWDALMGAYETAADDNKQVWFAIVIPDLKYSYYFSGEPSPIAPNALSVDAALETTLYITPTSEIEAAAPPTAS